VRARDAVTVACHDGTAWKLESGQRDWVELPPDAATPGRRP